MLSKICRAVLRSLDRCLASADFSRRLPLGPAHSLEPLEARSLCSAATLPVVSITALHPHASQSGNPAVFVITRTGSLKAPLTVEYSVADDTPVDAVAGVDYQALPGNVTIPKGKAKAKITLTPLPDADPNEGARALDIQILPSADYTTSTTKLSAAASIASGGITPWVSITAATNLLPGPAIITEGVRPGLMDIRLSSNLFTVPVTVGFDVSGTAPDSRYTLEEATLDDSNNVVLIPITDNTVTFQPGETDFIVNIVAPDDGVAEAAQTITLTLDGAEGCNIQSTGASATLKIQDMNAKPMVDTKKWPVMPVKVPAGTTPTTVDVFPLNVAIINKGTTPTGLFDVTLYAVDPAHPYDPNYQNFLGTVHFVGLDPTDYPTDGLEPGEEETESISQTDATPFAVGTYKLLIVVNPTLDQVTDGVTAAAANTFLDPTTFQIVILPLPKQP